MKKCPRVFMQLNAMVLLSGFLWCVLFCYKCITVPLYCHCTWVSVICWLRLSVILGVTVWFCIAVCMHCGFTGCCIWMRGSFGVVWLVLGDCLLAGLCMHEGMCLALGLWQMGWFPRELVRLLMPAKSQFPDNQQHPCYIHVKQQVPASHKFNTSQ